MKEITIIFNSADFTWLWSSLLGIGGTMLGTLFGWLLSKKSKKQLTLGIKSQHYNPDYEYEESLDPKHEYLHKIDYGFYMVVFNPSDLTKTIRDGFFEAYGKHKELLIKSSLNISEEGQHIDMGNILPHHGTIYHAEGIIRSEDLKKKSDIKEMYIVYSDENNKRRKSKCCLDFLAEDFIFEIPHDVIRLIDDEHGE